MHPDHLCALLVGLADCSVLVELLNQVLQVIECVIHELGASDAHLVSATVVMIFGQILTFFLDVL